MRWFLMLLLTYTPTGLAQDGDSPLQVDSARDITKAAEAGKSDGEILAAIKSSAHEWRAKDVFEILDGGVSEDVARGLASQLGLYWEDWYRPLDDIAADARKFGEASTMKLNDSNIIVLFEWFNDLKYEKEAAEKAVGSLAPKGAGELDRDFDLRKRKYAVDKANAVGAADGKIDALTIELELTGEWEAFDARRGCGRAKLNKVVNEVDYFVFRETLGTLGNVNEVEMKSRSVGGLRFSSNPDRRIEGESFDVCTSEGSYGSMAGKPVKLQATLKRTYDGKWSGRGEFVQGGNRIPAQR